MISLADRKYKIVPVKLKAHVKEMMSINEMMLPEHYIVEYWAFIIAQHHSYVVLDKDKVIGYCLAGVPTDPRVTDRYQKDKSNRPSIVSLAVLKEYQGLKLGKKLLMHACQSLQTTYTGVNLNVRKSNTRAHNLYLSLGFTDAMIMLQYYLNEDAILMTKTF